uniref:LAGLIDADG DNA endonuclease n=1 Tax=Prototheca wickerhamii TaxID=3111 RepID=A0A873HVU1_PROWI|nr:LAGLIDADG DNA endonuclease [Prototheca wickerhamii]
MNLQTQWIIGFIDGKGSFNVSIKNGNKVGLSLCNNDNNINDIITEFSVLENYENLKVLYALKKKFGCGTIKQNQDNLYLYSIKNNKHLYEKVIPFFEKHKLKTIKRIDFEKFRYIVISVHNNSFNGEEINSENFKDLKKYIIDWFYKN